MLPIIPPTFDIVVMKPMIDPKDVVVVLSVSLSDEDETMLRIDFNEGSRNESDA